MFDLIFALIILPIFVAAAICYRSWLRFNESQRMFPKSEEELEELETIFTIDVEGARRNGHLLKHKRRTN